MKLFGLSITRNKSTVEATKATGMDLVTRLPTPQNNWLGSWLGSIHEPFAGAWQRNVGANVPDVMGHSTAWACVTLIASDIAKLRPTLIEEVEDGIWEETDNSAYSPVLRKPNHYQNRIQFLTCWMLSKLLYGNTYVLKERDGSNKVRALYVLDPNRVSVLVAADGGVFYSLNQDYLSGLNETAATFPASEIIHDINIPLYHPLVGVSPIHACGRAVLQSLKIQDQSEQLFENGSQPGGILSTPHAISPEIAERIRRDWAMNHGGPNNRGKTAVLGDDFKFTPMAFTAVDSQLIEQLGWGDEKICAVFHVPGYKVGVGPTPANINVEALDQQYYSQCLQSPIESIELCLDEGMELPAKIGVEIDLSGLLRMDSATQMEEIVKGVRGGVYTPNDGRRKKNLKPLKGGDTVYLQIQDTAIEAIARRDEAAIAAAPSEPDNQALPSSLTQQQANAMLSYAVNERLQRAAA